MHRNNGKKRISVSEMKPDSIGQKPEITHFVFAGDSSGNVVYAIYYV